MKFINAVVCLICLFTSSTAVLGIIGPLVGISSDPNDVQFFYISSSGVKTEIVYGSNASLTSSGFNKQLPTIVVIDGFLSTSTTPMASTLKDSLSSLYGSNANLIVVDYGKLSGAQSIVISLLNNAALALPFYTLVLFNVPIVGTRVADFVDFTDVNPAKVQIIGHSLGAHVAGYAGRTYASNKNGVKLQRITGLDPAGPLYQREIAQSNRLHASDAVFVDAYHTARGTLGTTDTDSGTVDIFLNGGSSQPGCEVLDLGNQNLFGLANLIGYCSHSYSWQFFNYALTNVVSACSCDAVDLLSTTSCFCNNCNSNCHPNAIQVGQNIPSTATGTDNVILAKSFV